jgi:preprotein translocase subunit SecF
VFGDGSIYDFAFTMLIGIIAGTYSTVFIASPIMLWWYRGKRPEFEAEEKKSEN